MNPGRVVALGAALLALIACARPPHQSAIASSSAEKVLIVGIPGVSWSDIAGTPALSIRKLMARGASAAVAVRVSNKAGEAYATLGAGQRTDASHSAGWAFNADEVVENSEAASLLTRRGGTYDGDAVVVVTIAQIKVRNTARAFEARPGFLAESLRARKKIVAVIGNGDYSKGPLPLVLPSPRKMELKDAPDPGIHREAVLAVMDRMGGVVAGDVGRGLLEEDEQAAFGIGTSKEALTRAFRGVWASSDLVVVEIGDTGRADAYSAGLDRKLSKEMREAGLERADDLLGDLLQEVDLDSTLVVLIAPTTPGGPTQRGELRPAVIAGPGIDRGVLTSPNTRRKGIIVLPDVTALVASSLDAGSSRFAAGRVPFVTTEEDALGFMLGLNERAVAHDKARLPISATAVGLQFLIYVTAIVVMRSRGAAPMPGWMQLLLVGSVAFPGASFASTWGSWSRNPSWLALAILLATSASAFVALAIFRGRPLHASTVLLGATAVVFTADLVIGAPSQIDSILGYTSVAAGRFFGLGNLGFAIYAAASLLVAGSLAGSSPRSKALALGMAVVALIVVGHPLLGADVGGTIAMAAAVGVFGFGLFGRRLPRYSLPLFLAAIILLIGAFGAIDLARPPVERTHVGDFVAQLINAPLGVWPLIRRKAGLAVALAVSTGWGVGAVGAGATLLWLQHRSRELLRSAFTKSPGLRAAMKAVIAAAIVGSLVNDSGLAVAGMMLTMATPWMLLLANASSQQPRS